MARESKADLLETVRDLRQRLAEAETALSALPGAKICPVGDSIPEQDRGSPIKGFDNPSSTRRAPPKSESQFRSLADKIPQLCWIANADGWIFWYNQRWYQYTGTTPQQMEGWGWQSVHDPETLPEVLVQWKGSIATGEPFDMVFPLRGADGEFRPFLTRVMPERDGQGRVVRWFGTNTDISEQRKAEEALRWSEQRFRIAAEKANDVVYEWDLKQSVQWWGKIDEMLGYEPEEFPQTLDAWAAAVHPEDRERTMAAVHAHLYGGAAYAAEYRIRRKDGTCRWWSARGAAERTPDGIPVRWIGSITDITERKAVETALFESESRFRQLAESLPQLVWTCQPDGPCDYLSRQWVEFTGVPAAEQLGFGWLNQVHPDDHDGLTRAWNAAVASGGVFRVDFRIRRGDGVYRWFDAQAVPLRDDLGRIVKWFGSNTDTTERKQMEEALRESEARYRTLIENVPANIFLKSTDYRWVSINDGFARTLGFHPEDVRGKVDYDLFSEGVADKYRADDKRIMETGVTDEFDEEYIVGNEPRIVHTIKTPVRDERGVVTGVLGIFWDITERKRAEEALSLRSRIATTLLTVSYEGMFDEVLAVILNALHSPFGVFGYIDENGANVVPTMTRQVWDECDIPDKSIRFPRETWTDSSWPTAIRERRTVYSNEPSSKVPSGHVKIIRHISQPILLHGEAIGLFQVANKETDYTEADLKTLAAIADQVAPVLDARMTRKRAEDAIRQLNSELEQRVADRTIQLQAANKELEAFAFSVSHDLRAPLRALDGFSDALISQYRDLLDDQGKHYLQRIRDGSLRMGQLIDDLLNLSRITRRTFDQQPVDLSELAIEIAAELRAEQPQRQVECAIAPGLAAFGDRQLLRIALQNLLGNAWKFTGACQSARIEFGARVQDGERVLFVRDNGAGFDMAYAGKLFTPFQRLHRMQEFPGTGIGLATVQRIVTRHGGRIWADAALGQGATFYFTLGEQL